MRELTYSQALNEALREEMERDPLVFVFGEDVAQRGGIFGVTKGLRDLFGGQRVRDTPISEAAIAGAAVGAALTGTRPVAEIMYVDFMPIAMDQLINQAAKLRYMFGGKAKVPMVIRTQQGGYRNNAAQHSQNLEAWFTHIPGLKVVMPSTPYDAKGLLRTAIRDDNPVIFLEHKNLYFRKGPVPEEEYSVPFGMADIKREGRDLTIVALAEMVHKSLTAAETLAQEGISAEVIDPRTLVPLDLNTILESVKKTGRLVIVQEAHRRGGVGADLGIQVQEAVFDYLDAPIARVAAKDVPIPYNEALERFVLPSETDIVNAARSVCAGARLSTAAR